MRTSQICAKLSRNEPVLVTTLHLCDATIFEMASLMGYDGLWIDMEHHAHGMDAVQNLMRAARVGRSDIIARPAKGEFMRMGRMLEAGAQGILYPRCDDAAEAAELVKWAKFPPLGKRGCDGGSADNPFCFTPTDRYLRLANEQTFLIAQIEDANALEQVDAILAVEGIDGVFLGPADFSALGGYPGQMHHPRIQDAECKIAEAARRAGKHWGRPVDSAADAQRLLDLGARIISHSADLLLIKEGLQRIQQSFTAVGFSFEPTSDLFSSFPGQMGEPHFGRKDRLKPEIATVDR